jgi:hypothetical protein
MVTAIPVLLLLGVTTALGIWLGVDYLKRVRSRPALVGFHLLLGMGGLEVLAMLLHGTPDRRLVPSGGLVTVAAALTAAAMITGLAAPLLGKQTRTTMNVVLAVHASVATAGFALLVAWMVLR